MGLMHQTLWLLGQSKSCYSPSKMFLKSHICPLQGWLRKSTEGSIPLQRCKHSPGTAGPPAQRERGDALAARWGWPAAGWACRGRCWQFGARCSPFPGVGWSPACWEGA